MRNGPNAFHIQDVEKRSLGSFPGQSILLYERSDGQEVEDYHTDRVFA